MKDEFNRKWIIEKAQEVIGQYAEGITLRQLYYRLVAQGMTNDLQHYKRVVQAMTSARWDEIVSMDSFIDRERSMYGKTEAEEKDVKDEIEQAKQAIKAWMVAYNLDRWSNQPEFVEIWIEKKALQGVFESPCNSNDVGLAACKGYPSLTFLNEAKKRFEMATDRGQDIVILYFGDYDPSGEDIPRSIKDNLERMGVVLAVERIALNPDLIRQLRLPSVPPKRTDSRTANWDGAGVVELDAVEPRKLQELCEEAIEKHFVESLEEELDERAETERKIYQEELKKFVEGL